MTALITGGQDMSSNPYDMGKPTERDLIAALQKLMGPAKAQELMDQANEYCGEFDSGDRLTEMVEWLCNRKGLASVVGRSMMIRIKFYDSIYRKYDYV